MMPAEELARHLVEGLFLDWHSLVKQFLAKKLMR
tara:strand:+ start:1313 stop:1414 length:102 start_codon:yes stop_codon:yes gene_type:complete